MLPPRRAGLPSPFKEVGERIVEQALIGIGELQPGNRVLDAGCGAGRVAVPLTRYLTGGSYDGFDVMPRSIHWARRKITSKHPNFRFQVADVHNLMYNPRGTRSADSYRFPYPDACFDVAVATSLYTHLRPYEIDNYLRETARVMKPGGRVLNTFFLLNAEAEKLLSSRPSRRLLAGGGNLELQYEQTDPGGWRFRANDPDFPEHLIAVYEDEVLAMYEGAGLAVEDVYHGPWCGRSAKLSAFGQDLVHARKR